MLGSSRRRRRRWRMKWCCATGEYRHRRNETTKSQINKQCSMDLNDQMLSDRRNTTAFYRSLSLRSSGQEASKKRRRRRKKKWWYAHENDHRNKRFKEVILLLFDNNHHRPIHCCDHFFRPLLLRSQSVFSLPATYIMNLIFLLHNPIESYIDWLFLSFVCFMRIYVSFANNIE